MGFDPKITDNSAAYLDSWIATLKLAGAEIHRFGNG